MGASKRKRGQGEGTIFRRRDGRWCAVLNLGWRGGKRLRKSFYAATREQVAALLAKAKTAHDSGLPITHGSDTVADYLNRWLDQVRPTIRPRTFEAYELYIRKHAIPVVGKTRLSAVRPAHVRTLLTFKLEEGMSPRSALHLRTILRTAFQQGVGDRVLAWNPVSAVKPPAVPCYNYKVLDSQQALAFLKAAENSSAEAPLVCAIATGARLGEITGLRWCDVDLEFRTIRIAQTIQRLRAKFAPDGKAGYRIAEPKTEKSWRVIEIAEMLVPILRRHRARQAQARLAAGAVWRNLDLVFTNVVGGPLDPRALRREFRNILERVGLPRMRIQDLRHSASTLLLAAGTPLHVVSRILGHSTITLTSNTYGHYTAEMRADAAERMNRILGGSSSK